MEKVLESKQGNGEGRQRVMRGVALAAGAGVLAMSLSQPLGAHGIAYRGEKSSVLMKQERTELRKAKTKYENEIGVAEANRGYHGMIFTMPKSELNPIFRSSSPVIHPMLYASVAKTPQSESQIRKEYKEEVKEIKAKFDKEIKALRR